MIEQILQAYQGVVNLFSSGNEFAAGMVSVWLLTIIAWLLRSVPKAIYLFLKRQFTTTMTMNNGGWDEKNTMSNFMKWIGPRVNESWSRTLSVDSNYKEEGLEANTGLGYGIHFFFWNKRLFWINKAKLESSGSERQKEEISISTFGRSHAPFKEMVKYFSPEQKENVLKIYHLEANGDWRQYTETTKRPMESIACSKSIKDFLKKEITHFKDNRQWFYDKGLAHKLTFLLEGQPGTGKSSLIKAIASEWSMNLCVINITHISDKMLEKGLATAPKNSLIVMEDFDSSSATKNRQEMMVDEDGVTLGLSLTGILNALDGVNPIDDCIVVMTTNHLEQVDQAIYRKGRVDHILTIKEVDGQDVREYSQYLYPDHDSSNVEFNSCLGCWLNEALLCGKEDANMYIDSLRERGAVKEE